MVLTGLVMAFSSAAAWAYTLDYGYVQYRIYEDGSQVNRLNFALLDSNGAYVSSGDVVTGTQLFYRTDGTQEWELAATPEITFWGPEYPLSGQYNATDGSWVYGSQSTETGFSSDLSIILKAGQYRLDVSTNDDQIIQSGPYEYHQLIQLPVVSSDSFQLIPDEQGNLVWTWQIPQALDTVNSAYGISVRAHISIYQNELFTGDTVTVKVPASMGRIFIPSDVVQTIQARGGDSYRFRIQIRTNDNNNRSYSKNLSVSSLQTTLKTVFSQDELEQAVTAERSKYDPDRDGRIGLEEAIYALQVTAGVRTEVSAEE